MVLKVKDNYLYAFVDNEISRYIISNATLSISENRESKELIQFINPFHNELNFKTNENIKSTEFYDESGQLVLKNKRSKNINTSSLDKGVYIIKITTESNKIISKK